MTRGRRRTLIPHAYSDLTQWPEPDSEIARSDPKFSSRRLAVEMYANGDSQETILESTGKDRGEVRRLVKRCLTLADDGQIAGFYALLNGWRTEGYVRTSKVVHTIGSGSGGCSGALRQLFDRFPEVEEHIQSLFFKDDGPHAVQEARISYQDLHAEFKSKLEELGLSENDWPFNTAGEGYQALRRYCIGLLHDDSNRWIAARSGEEAARRGAVGSGRKPILPRLRGFGAVQLDFHLVDAASVILVENYEGVDIPIPVPRWHIGLMVEERWGLVIGVFIALEFTPSGDSVLETIETALRPLTFDESNPRCAFVVDGKVLPNQLFPELAFQGFSVLKMDNAKSNAAAEVVSNIIDTVGCAVNFGPVRAWWRRDLIERIFGKLTRKGLQRLPSTLGSSPTDTRRSKSPNAEAVRFEIKHTELVAIIYGCIRKHNEARTKKLHQASPVDALEAAMRHPASGFLSLPLPRVAQENLKLMSHIEEVTVRGSRKDNVRPHINIGGWRYTNATLAQSYDLIGQKLIAYCDRRASQIVSVTVKETGEQLGCVEPPRQWTDIPISFRDRAIINSTGEGLRHSENGLSTVREWVNQKAEKLAEKYQRRSKRPRTAKEALAVARISTKLAEAEASRSKPADPVSSRSTDTHPISLESSTPNELSVAAPEPKQNHVVKPQVRHENVPGFDPFGLHSIPDMYPVEKGD